MYQNILVIILVKNSEVELEYLLKYKFKMWNRYKFNFTDTLSKRLRTVKSYKKKEAKGEYKLLVNAKDKKNYIFLNELNKTKTIFSQMFSNVLKEHTHKYIF